MEARSPTPTVSPTPDTTPSSDLDLDPEVMAKLEVSKLKGRSMKYATMRTNERKAVKTAIEKHFDTNTKQPGNCSKLSIVADQDKLGVLKNIRDETIQRRERKGTGSLKISFPDDYDEDAEHEWLKHLCRLFLDEMPVLRPSYDDDMDDPEDLPPRKIKQEPVESNRSMPARQSTQQRPNYHESSTEPESTTEMDDEDEDDPDESVVCDPVSTRHPVAIDVSSVLGKGKAKATEANTVDTILKSLPIKPHWKWVGMQMVVWQPSHRPEEVAETTSNTGEKRELEAGSESSSPKRVKFSVP